MKKASTALALLLSVSVFMAGCGGDASGYVKDNYSLVEAQNKGNDIQKVYRAENKSVQDVAKQIADEQKPDEMSKADSDHMFLVYSDNIIHVQKDPEKDSDTLIETDSKQYVKDNYDPNFLEGFITAAVISSMFGNNYHSRSYTSYYGYGDSHYRSKYPSYSYPGQYKPSTGSTPAPKTGSSSSGSPSSSSSKPSNTPAPPKSSSGTGSVINKSSGSSSSSSSSSSGSSKAPSSSSGTGSISKSSGSSSSSKKK